MSLTREQLLEQIHNGNACNIDLLEADLSDADLSRANLRGAGLTGANLSGADLSDADLRGANLFGADLSGADLARADLLGADMTRADLRGANLLRADLRGANLSGADLSGADLNDANLLGAYLSDADLSDVNGLAIAEDATARLIAVAQAALQPGALEMSESHTYNAVHSISGWAVHQAGELGRVLEAAVGSHMAGLYLLGVEAASHFYDSNEAATKYLKGVLAAAEQQPAMP